MSTEQGIILKVTGERALVKVKRSSMCEGCNSSGACHSLGGANEMEAEALNLAEASEGDHVLLSMNPRSVLKIAFLVYLVPVIALVIGAIVGEKYASRYSFSPEFGAFFLAVIAFTVVMIPIKYIGNKMGTSDEYTPKIIKVIPPVPSNDSNAQC